MTATSRKLLLGFGLLGLGASSTSSYVHYKLLTEPSYTSFCDVNTTVSCTEAYLSRYGSFWGVPVALGGVLFFAVVLLLAGVGGREKGPARESVPGYIFALSTLGLAFVLYLAWASYVQLKTFCILCAVTYVAVVAIFIISGGATTFPMTTLPRRAVRDVRYLVSSPVALMILLLFVMGAGGVIEVFPREGVKPQAATLPAVSEEDRVKLAQWWDVQPKVDIPIPSDGAKVLVIKFSDYQCPACRQTYDGLKGVFAKWVAGGQVKFVLKHFPLEGECNPNAPNGNHFAACEAAAAVVMARSKGTADKLEEWIFANQPTLTPSVVRQAAKDIGKIDDFDAKYAQALQEVKTDASLGGLVGVNSTPTFFVNGRKLPGAGIPPQFFDALIDLELKRAK